MLVVEVKFIDIFFLILLFFSEFSFHYVLLNNKMTNQICDKSSAQITNVQYVHKI